MSENTADKSYAGSLAEETECLMNEAKPEMVYTTNTVFLTIFCC